MIAEAGYPNGFEMKVITYESWKLEAKIICNMLERIGLNAKAEIYSFSDFLIKIFIPLLDKPPEEQEWDLEIGFIGDWFGHPGATFFTYSLLEESNFRWIEYDPGYEEMWKRMAMLPQSDAQEERLRKLVRYLHRNAYSVTIYSPLTLYAVNKEVNFVPQKSYWLRLKETSVTENHWSIRGKNH